MTDKSAGLAQVYMSNDLIKAITEHRDAACETLKVLNKNINNDRFYKTVKKGLFGSSKERHFDRRAFHNEFSDRIGFDHFNFLWNFQGSRMRVIEDDSYRALHDLYQLCNTSRHVFITPYQCHILNCIMPESESNT